MEIQNTPVLGGTAPRHATRTAQRLANFALGWLDSIPRNSECLRYLDVGCGNGFITELVAPSFDEVVGIDMEEERLEDFRAHVNGKPNFQILLMSAARVEFPSEFFPFITAFEVLEHVPDLDTSVREMVRVCRQGGVIVVSVPQVWFPFENHGAQIGDKVYARKIPFLPYIRPLHILLRECFRRPRWIGCFSPMVWSSWVRAMLHRNSNGLRRRQTLGNARSRF